MERPVSSISIEEYTEAAQMYIADQTGNPQAVPDAETWERYRACGYDPIVAAGEWLRSE